VGAALAGRLDELQDSLSAYGDPLGEAFQLRDDLLGAFGEEAATGKPVGDDLREGKPTPLLAVATANADPLQAGVLGDVGRIDLDSPAVERIQEVLVDTGAVRSIEASIDALTSDAIAAIKVADITDEARGALVDLAQFVAWRES
jgi:geranylgeranyl diphosphate synthase type I